MADLPKLRVSRALWTFTALPGAEVDAPSTSGAAEWQEDAAPPIRQKAEVTNAREAPWGVAVPRNWIRLKCLYSDQPATGPQREQRQWGWLWGRSSRWPAP